MFLLKIISRLPFPVLYTIADGLYILIYHFISYRKKVVFDNLKKSFPEKSEAEIKTIAKGFYKNLIDVILETIKLLTLSEKALRERVAMENPEEIQKFYSQHKSVVVLTSHQCNWEWLLVSCSLQLDHAVDAVYLRLNNAFSENLMKTIRSRFEANLIEKGDLFRSLVTRKNIVRIIAMVGDQAPSHDANVLWTTFLNQDTNFFTGGEKIGTKLNLPVIYVEMSRIKRGYYKVGFETLAEFSQSSQNDEITTKYIHALEKTIQNNPSDWLWSHKRWKYAYKRAGRNGTTKPN